MHREINSIDLLSDILLPKYHNANVNTRITKFNIYVENRKNIKENLYNEKDNHLVIVINQDIITRDKNA